MAKNKNLTQAKKAKNDEFYTLISDVEKELKHYKSQFEGKVVYCNCDDPEESNFWKFFELNFEEYKLKKLISTHYDAEKPTYKLELSADIDGDGKITKGDIVKTPLKQNGDFRSEESINLLKESDIIVTNPPFSLVGTEYIPQLMKYKKKFLIMCNMNVVICKEVFPYIFNKEIWSGYSFNKALTFRIPDTYEAKWEEDGKKYTKVPGISWLTNLEVKNRKENLILTQKFDISKFPAYDNYCAFHIDKTVNIPKDKEIKIPIPQNLDDWKKAYGEDLKIIDNECIIKRPIWGVPITFLEKHNPSQFKILGQASGNSYGSFRELIMPLGFNPNIKYGGGLGAPILNGKATYSRLLIQNIS